jgi:hypothetical protein
MAKAKIINKNDELKHDLAKETKRILALRNQLRHADADREELVLVKLNAAEEVFFTLFNQLRIHQGFKPLDGRKFTGEHRYESYLFHELGA